MSGTNSILIVDGFDRADRSLNVRYPYAFTGDGLVDRIWPRLVNSFDYTVQVGEAIEAYDIPLGFDAAQNEAIVAGTIDLDDYDTVIWILGEESTDDSTFDATEQTLVEQFIAGYMKSELRGPPRIVHAPGHSFSDVAAKCVHIVNLASVREVERVAGRKIDPLRFRPNIVIDGVDAWAEFGWIDHSITIGDARLDVFTRTERCDATNVDPETGKRDMAIPALLRRTYGHSDFGVYALVASPGVVRTGDTVVGPAD